jgi:hypothetical protein
MDELIEHMKDCGWEETEAGIHLKGRTSDDDYYYAWVDAIKACIEVASGV